MPPHSSLPRLRPLDVRRVMHNGRPYFLLRDPQQIAEGQLLVPQQFGPILSLCDGTLTPEAIGASVRTTYGLPIDDHHVAELLEVLDKAAFLDNGVYAQRLADALVEWRAADVRPMALAGAGYPESRRGLARLLNQYLAKAGDVEAASIDWSDGVGLLSPHIDYGRGGEVYARVWKRAQLAVREAEVAVVFGTDHHGDDPVTLTRLPYATPYGTLPVDKAVVDAVEQAVAAIAGAAAPYAGELRHRNEHSLELVLTWLHHMRGGTPLPVATILVGSMARPAAKEMRVASAVVEAVHKATAGRRALIVASGDLAHVGQAFDGEPLDDEGRQRIRRDDGRLMQQMEAGDAEGFLREIRRTANGNNVCGVTPIYLTMRAVGALSAAAPSAPARRVAETNGHSSNGLGSAETSALEAETLGYAICPADEEGTSVVTVAGLLFRGRRG